MSNGHLSRPAIPVAGANDAGARLAHLEDLVARAAGNPASGLPAVFHECVGAGAMRTAEDDRTVLLTLVTAAGESHVFALGRPVAEALRTSLRLLPASATATGRAPVLKPAGRLL